MSSTPVDAATSKFLAFSMTPSAFFSTSSFVACVSSFCTISSPVRGSLSGIPPPDCIIHCRSASSGVSPDSILCSINFCLLGSTFFSGAGTFTTSGATKGRYPEGPYPASPGPSPATGCSRTYDSTTLPFSSIVSVVMPPARILHWSSNSSYVKAFILTLFSA